MRERKKTKQSTRNDLLHHLKGADQLISSLLTILNQKASSSHCLHLALQVSHQESRAQMGLRGGHFAGGRDLGGVHIGHVCIL